MFIGSVTWTQAALLPYLWQIQKDIDEIKGLVDEVKDMKNEIKSMERDLQEFEENLHKPARRS